MLDVCYLFYGSQCSPKGQVGEDGDRQEDGRDSTANICDKSKDGVLEATDQRLSGEVLQEKEERKQINYTAECNIGLELLCSFHQKKAA